MLFGGNLSNHRATPSDKLATKILHIRAFDAGSSAIWCLTCRMWELSHPVPLNTLNFGAWKFWGDTSSKISLENGNCSALLTYLAASTYTECWACNPIPLIFSCNTLSAPWSKCYCTIAPTLGSNWSLIACRISSASGPLLCPAWTSCL